MDNQEAPRTRELDDWIASYMDYTENTEPPKIYRYWVAVSCISSVLQRKVRIPWGKETTWYPNFYVCLVGPSGKARKSTAMRTGQNLLHEVDNVQIASDSVTREALIEELEKCGQVDIDENDNAIPHSSMTIFSKELTVFLGYDNMQLMMDLTDWYDCANKWIYSTKSQGTNHIDGVWVSLLGATTPSSIKTSLPEDSIGGGFTSRMIFVYAEEKGKRVYHPWKVDNEEDLRDDLINDLKVMSDLMGEIRMTPELEDAWVTLYDRVEENPPVEHPRFSGYNQRRPSHTIKLALIFSAARRNNLLITKQDFEDADNLLKETEKKMAQTFYGMGKSKHSDTVWSIVRYLAKKEEASMADLMRRYGHDVDDKDVMQDIIDKLSVRNFLYVTTKDRMNGAETHVEVNKDSEDYKRVMQEVG